MVAESPVTMWGPMPNEPLSGAGMTTRSPTLSPPVRLPEEMVAVTTFATRWSENVRVPVGPCRSGSSSGANASRELHTAPPLA